MPTHQIWSCDVTQVPNFERKLFFPNSTFDISKVTKFLLAKLLLQKLSAKNFTGGGVSSGGGGVPLGLKNMNPSQH